MEKETGDKSSFFIPVGDFVKVTKYAYDGRISADIGAVQQLDELSKQIDKRLEQFGIVQDDSVPVYNDLETLFNVTVLLQ